MLHSHVRNWLHIVWATKGRMPIISPKEAIQISTFIIEKSKEMNVSLLNVNIQPEHVHELINLPANICLADYMKKIKGSSSHWINKNNLFSEKFSWQRGYGAYSVSASQIEKVKNYIIKQNEHHKKSSFEKEYNKWKKQYGFFDD